MTKFNTFQAQFRRELKNTTVKLNNTEDKLNDTREKLETARQQVKKTDKRFVWKIDNFSNLLRQAKTGESLVFSSDPFCGTESCGYKLRMKMYPNGSRPGKNTHVLVYIFVMKSEYDAMLPWPFKKKVTFTLIDQQEDPVERKSVTLSLMPGDVPGNFARPIQEENTGRGFNEFISHEKLDSRRYLVDDTLFLQVEIGP